MVCDDAGGPPQEGWRLDDGARCDLLKPTRPPAPPPAADADGGGRFEFHGGEPGGGGGNADGAKLCSVIGEAIPPVGGSTGPPRIQLFPRSGGYVERLGVRACFSDPDGIKDVDCGSLRVSLDGVDLTDDMIWGWTLPDRVCGVVQNGTFQRGWRTPAGNTAQAKVSIADSAGEMATDEVTYRRAAAPAVTFEEQGLVSGLSEVLFKGNTHNGGVAWVDIDDDDLPDLYLGNGAGRDNRLLRNRGDGTFEDVTAGTPLAHTDHETSAVLFADVDNDGDDDLYAIAGHPKLTLSVDGGGFDENPVPGHRSALFLNHGGGRCWEDATIRAGLLDQTVEGTDFRAETGAFADYDRDGCVDLYVVHRRLGGVDDTYDPDRLYRNNCDGTFSDATAAAGIDDDHRDGLGVLFEDLDGDLWPDLLIIHTAGGTRYTRPRELGRMTPDAGDDMLWLNRGDGTFELLDPAQTGLGTHSFAGMGVAAADFDRDGDIDLHVTDIDEPLGLGNPVYRSLLAQTGELRFEEVSFELGDVAMSGDSGWGTLFADLDNDGWQDLFYVGPKSRWLYLGDGAGGFHALTGPQGGPGAPGEIHGVPDILEGRGLAAADYDGDGFGDLLAMQENQRALFLNPQLLHNATAPGPSRHWLQVRLRPALSPVGSNGAAIGARVEVRPEGSAEAPERGPMLLRQVSGGHSAFSQSEKVLHFGLGGAQSVGLVTVRWPGGRVQHLCDVAADELLTVYEPSNP